MTDLAGDVELGYGAALVIDGDFFFFFLNVAGTGTVTVDGAQVDVFSRTGAKISGVCLARFGSFISIEADAALILEADFSADEGSQLVVESRGKVRIARCSRRTSRARRRARAIAARCAAGTST